MFTEKNIFIAALDWGTGHATRCIPLIRELQKNNRIIIGVTPSTAKIFQEEFSALPTIELPSYDIAYSRRIPLWLKLATQFLKIRSVIRREHAALPKNIQEHKIDVVISDNRFGLCSNDVHSVFLTHQVFLQAPFVTSFLQSINKKYIIRFNELWIPDHEEENSSLSGKLSHGEQFHSNVKFIGPLSRLEKVNAKNNFDYLFLLSGPEPQLSILTDLLIKKAQKFPDKKFALCTSSSTVTTQLKNLNVFTGLTSPSLSEIIQSSETIICRSGYSTLMDLDHLDKKKMILIPTPGQTEQEYLAEWWKEKRGALVYQQHEIGEMKLI